MKTGMLAGLMFVGLALIACKAKQPSTPAGAPGEAAQKAQAEHGDEKAHGKAGEKHGDEKEHAETGEEHGREKVIALSPEAMRSAGIQLVQVGRKPLTKHLGASARISLPPERTAKVAPRVPGRVASISVQVGHVVKRSTVLAIIESPDLGRARADYLAAATKARVAEDNFTREKNLLAKGITSEKEMREAETAFVTAKAEVDAADAQLHAFGLTEAEIRALKSSQHYSSRFPVRSPIDGTVVELDATIGETVESTAPLFTVADLDELWVLLDVFESQLSQVAKGQHVHLTVASMPNQVFDGRVDYVGDVVDEKSRSVKVRVVVPNKNRALKPGMFATAEIGAGGSSHDGKDAAAGTARLVVPRGAVQQVGQQNIVFVSPGEGRFRPVEVRIGESTGEEVEILSGVEPGTKVVGAGAFILKSELMKESMGEGHGH